MDAEWIKSPTARRILVHWADSRPAWLWSHDGTTLLWRNAAARYFNSRIKKNAVRFSPEAVPIKGQVSRLIRLGSPGRSSLSRVQFLAGEKPVATTCTCTPLFLPDDEMALLLVGIDPIAPDLMEDPRDLPADAMTKALLPIGMDYQLVVDGRVRDGSRVVPPDDSVEFRTGSDDTALVIFAAQARKVEPSIDSVRDEEGAAADEDSVQSAPEPLLPMGLPPIPEAEQAPRAPADEWVEPLPDPAHSQSLSSLFDRLVDDAELYTALTEKDEVFAGPPPAADSESETERESEAAALDTVEQPDLIAAVIEYADDPEDDRGVPEMPAEEPTTHWIITGRGFRAIEPDVPVDGPDGPEPVPEPEFLTEVVAAVPLSSAADDDAAERVSRYNFEELGRILTDRVATDGPERPQPARPSAPRPVTESVINLSAETLVLNRLPLAILVFRDQQVLFANRALTDLLGYDGVQGLRDAGIASIFPTEDDASAGPVNRLVRRDGISLPVTARLQSVSWQGRPALMLSASPADTARGHEGAVRAFAEIAAEARDEGFLIADRAGIVTQISGHGRVLLGKSETATVGKPLSALLGKSDGDALRSFLERPARFAETARPSLVATTENGDVELVLFAEGQAGVVTGYFGFIKARMRPIVAASSDDELEPSMLGRLSRGIRRPLNTIIGFADLLRTAGLSKVDGDRTAEYARDIRTAGLEIAVLADELDDFTRLRDGRYAPRPSEVELAGLLESCMVRVKSQASAARVLVRSGISEMLPRIRVDRASLGQALLNLLASAIDQTPVGGSVILSAQVGEDGGIAIHVRDGASAETDLGERFVVFRDGVDKDGEQLAPVRSSVGLALTRSLLAVNACSLSVDPTAGVGTLFSLMIPADLVVRD